MKRVDDSLLAAAAVGEAAPRAADGTRDGADAERAPREQRWLAERLSFWRARIEAALEGRGGGLAPAAAAAEPGPPPPEPTADGSVPRAWQLAACFGLSPFERELLLLAAGIEIDLALRDAVARAQGESGGAAGGRPLRIDFSFALALLPEPHWDAISPAAPLRHRLLVDADTRDGLAHARLRIDERVLHAWCGVAAFDPRLAGIAWLHDGDGDGDGDSDSDSDSDGHGNGDSDGDPGTAGGDADRRTAGDRAAGAGRPPSARRIADAAARHARTLVALCGSADSETGGARAARRHAARVLRASGLHSLCVDATALPADAAELTDTARRIDREAVLCGAGVVLLLPPAALPAVDGVAARLARALAAPRLVVAGAGAALDGWPALAEPAGRSLLRFEVGAERAAPPPALPPGARQAVQRGLRQFSVDADSLAQALGGIDLPAVPDDALDTVVWAALREAARGGLDGLAQRIDDGDSGGFESLVVPPFVESQLRAIASQLRHRATVYDDWGFGPAPAADDRRSGHAARGLGIAALFAGDSGTGKTLAAEAIAHEAGLDLYRVDLAGTVSKYIGETEKNLARLFDAAERSGAVLLFDEADALFGKRSEVKDSHDRYANLEVAYLLQRIERYRGLAILTTNLKTALDRAFLRRIRFVVQFPFPDAAARERIWRRVLPAAAPTAGLDVAALGRLAVAGGSIRNIAVNAAFLAAERGGPIDMRCVAAAARAEFAKLERAPGDAALEALR